MKVTLEDAGPCRKIMHVAVPPEAVAPAYGEVVSSFTKRSRVAGFRPGKAPPGVAERYYARAITQETQERLVPRFYREALKRAGITPVAIVGVADVKFEKAAGLAFRVTMDVPPQFKLPRYRKLTLKEEKIAVGDAEVERAYGRFLQSQARYEDVAGRAVRADDLALVDFRGECAGRPVAELAGEAAGLGEGRDFWVLAGEPEFLPGFSAGLLGAAVGEERSLRVCFPADYRVRELAGREADYKVRVKALRERKPPVVDAEFLKRCEADSEQALREKIRTQLQKEAARIEKERLRAQVVQYLLERTELDVPQSLVEEETSLTVREMVRRIAMEGGTREQILQQRESILNTATRSSTERVRISYILSRIADEERIQVEDRALDERIEALARQAGMPAQRLRAELEKRNGLEGLRSDLRAEQTLEFILEQARIRS